MGPWRGHKFLIHIVERVLGKERNVNVTAFVRHSRPIVAIFFFFEDLVSSGEIFFLLAIRPLEPCNVIHWLLSYTPRYSMYST